MVAVAMATDIENGSLVHGNSCISQWLDALQEKTKEQNVILSKADLKLRCQFRYFFVLIYVAMVTNFYKRIAFQRSFSRFFFSNFSIYF